jgi:hypothetical protein
MADTKSHRETAASGGSTSTAAERIARHPEATPAAGGAISRRIYQAVRDFTDLHGCGWGRKSLVPVPDEEVEELLARGDIRIYEGMVLGDHLGEPVPPGAMVLAGYPPKIAGPAPKAS